MRTLAPDQTLAFFDRLQVAFYAENLDLTDSDVLVALAAEFGIEPGLFRRCLAIDDTTKADFAEASTLGAKGFPMLLLDTGIERIVVSAGYNRAERILTTIRVLSTQS